jgi:hypothetical protein
MPGVKDAFTTTTGKIISVLTIVSALAGMIFGTVTWMFDTFTSTDDFVQNNTVVLAKLDANHKEAMDNMELRYLDIIISLKERDLRELDELVDSGVTLDSEQQRRQNSLERAIEAHRQHRAELIGIPQGLD